MVYTANWGLIYHLPPIKGTRKLHWLKFHSSNMAQRRTKKTLFWTLTDWYMRTYELYLLYLIYEEQLFQISIPTKYPSILGYQPYQLATFKHSPMHTNTPRWNIILKIQIWSINSKPSVFVWGFQTPNICFQKCGHQKTNISILVYFTLTGCPFQIIFSQQFLSDIAINQQTLHAQSTSLHFAGPFERI